MILSTFAIYQALERLWTQLCMVELGMPKLEKLMSIFFLLFFLKTALTSRHNLDMHFVAHMSMAQQFC